MNLRGIDLNLLVVLEALLREKNVSRAGEIVGLSQSATSAALGRLRDIFHDPLLVRVGRQLALTQNAENLIEPLRDALSKIRQTLMQQGGFDPLTDKRTFTISASDYAVLVLLGPLVKRLEAEAPNVTIHLLPRSRETEKMLVEDRVDVVIEPSELLPGSEFPSEALISDRWLCAADFENTLIGGERTLSLQTFLTAPHLTYGIGLDRQLNLADQHLAREGVNRRIAATVESFVLVPFLLRGSNLISLVLERAIKELAVPGIGGFEPPLVLPDIHERMYWHPRHTSDQAHIWLRGRISGLANNISISGTQVERNWVPS
ncbi:MULTISPECIES: LysR family transcriptional regulator [unclassified Sinorhizobium]|uniref:LysR substrate-binding domain-containing protein n=1 Tax=unclassified Sinorhizobium TaxID=2613772 RepID=UPI0024C37129|nr:MULTISPECIES: LysR family transcriptional regulator [unclassified Sinorhizobium]MDK1376824.1 LysR substrate-binding domain-containing protein [Sinorhizobium sp. 6-70]MDK1481075.1 LysR substrate-binding domain-containing protein [Sinorhizobium sp. 6-117]